jgi:hypothetical protein
MGDYETKANNNKYIFCEIVAGYIPATEHKSIIIVAYEK